MYNNNFVKTLDFGCVPIRKNKMYIDGEELKIIDLINSNNKEQYASIRRDYRTNQPFAVLMDEELNLIVK